jgi:glucose-6-phosphate isomerase
MVAITSSIDKAIKWGFNNQNIFYFSKNIGGRYSLWSSVAMPIMLSIGENNFKDFLYGARMMDEHFINEDVENNIPIILALLRVWNRNFLNRNSHCIVPYSNRLAKLPSWAQQLEMESNGKGVDIEGEELIMAASPLIWGEVGTTAQHSFFQFLHQGLEIIPLDILLPLQNSNKQTTKEKIKNHKYLITNALAQADTLAKGSVNLINKNKNFLGGRPSTIISWQKNNPFSIGKLIALYENITIASGFIWNINSFDQWGVELGKKLALKIENNKEDEELTPASKFLLKQY